MPDSSATNATELSVSELSQALKRTVEDRFGHVRVRGEVSGWRGPHSSGHCYFALKDEGARIDAIIWKGTFGRLKFRPEEGLEVIATGKLTTYPGKSSYQIVIEAIEPAGVGALLAQLEERRRRLAAEGLFDEARKQLLPALPKVIGVVTSPTGAVIRDILHRIHDRFPLHVLVWPVRVQGETCGQEVARAIEGFNALPEGGRIARPDIIIVARGGGSLEDLWGFNDEVVVRAAAGSMIPLISAVGHETDWTLIDQAADRRAPTPTAAAEMAVPVRADLLAQTASFAARLGGARTRYMERQRAELRALVRAMPAPEDMLALPRQRTDRAGERMRACVEAALGNRQIRLARLASTLARHSPQAEFAKRRAHLDSLSGRLSRCAPQLARAQRDKLTNASQRFRAAILGRMGIIEERMQTQRARVANAHRHMRNSLLACQEKRTTQFRGLLQLYNSLNYTSVLARGFAIVRDTSDHPLAKAGDIGPGMALSLQFADGSVQAVAKGEGSPRTEPDAPARLAVRQKPTKPGTPGQGSLF
jgi:exodeoxyribonuclease VII large subunit